MRKSAILLALVLALPFGGVARAQFCPGQAPWVFTDVPASDAFCGFVTWMAQSAITLGCQTIDANNRIYCPNDFVTRKQMAGFMTRLGRDTVFADGGNAFGAPAVLGTTDNQPLDIRVNGVRVMRYEPNINVPNVIGGHSGNFVSAGAHGATIAGGGSPGLPNRVLTSAWYGTIGGGQDNASGRSATVGGGYSNVASGHLSTIPGGLENSAGGDATVAMGMYANAAHAGCFVWSDSSSGTPTSCFARDEFVARSLGGFYFWTSGTNDSNYAGARLAPGAGAWAVYSDVAGKENFAAVDPVDVAQRIAALPIATWNWTAQDAAIRHMGPTAQDFRAAFGLGESERMISSVDTDGVALAGVQGVYRLLERRDAEIAALRGELAELRRAVEALARRD